MIRVGIIGSESSHAMQFAKYFNLPDAKTGTMHDDDIRVTAIMGDAISAQKVANLAQVETIAGTVDELVNSVDAVMITSRRGSQHLEQALPFIKNRIPLFIDKPFTSSPKQAQDLAKMVLNAECPILAGSGCKYSASVQKTKMVVKGMIAAGKLLTASLSFAIMMDSPYDGFYFYASHLVEICMEIFGSNIQSVQATKTQKCLVANIQYSDIIVSLHFVTEVWSHSCTLITSDGVHTWKLDTSDSLTEEASLFSKLLHKEYESMSYSELVHPIMLIDAILRSEMSGETIKNPLIE